MKYSFYFKGYADFEQYAIIKNGTLTFTFNADDASQWDSLQDMIMAIAQVQLPNTDFIISMKGSLTEFQEIDPKLN